MKATYQLTYRQPANLEEAYNQLFDLVYNMRKSQIKNTRQSIQKKNQDKVDAHLNELIIEKQFKL